MTRKIRLAVLFAALALPALPAARAEAATQILGIVASNGMPTSLQCQDGVCRGFFSSFCLEQDRPAPHVYAEYRLAAGGGLTLVAARADGSRVRLPAAGLVTLRSEIGFSSLSISISEARLKALGVTSAAIDVAPMTTALPVAVAGDPNPLTAEEIAYVTGKLRRLAEPAFEKSGKMNDEARLATMVVNSLPAEEPKTTAGRQAVWSAVMAQTAGQPIDPTAVAVTSRMFSDCGAAVDLRAEFNLSLCMQLHQTDLMSSFNRDFWDSLGGS
jgi:hypothetical protein